MQLRSLPSAAAGAGPRIPAVPASASDQILIDRSPRIRLEQELDVACVAQDDKLVAYLDDMESQLCDLFEEVPNTSSKSVHILDRSPDCSAVTGLSGVEHLIYPSVLHGDSVSPDSTEMR